MERLIWLVLLSGLLPWTGCDSSETVRDSQFDLIPAGDTHDEDDARRDLLSNPDENWEIDIENDGPDLDLSTLGDMPTGEDMPTVEDLQQEEVFLPFPDLDVAPEVFPEDLAIGSDEGPSSDLSSLEDTAPQEMGLDSEITGPPGPPDVVEEEVTIIEFGVVTMDNEDGLNTLEILLFNLEWIAGMQFEMVGIHADFSAPASGGRLETVSPTFPPTLSNPLDDRARLLWFAFPDQLPPGNGVITIFPFESVEGFTDVCFEGVILSDDFALEVPVVVGPCVSLE
jgi:hypothetical protein